MHAHGPDVFFVAAPDQREQVVDVAVHAAVREQPDEVHRLAALADALGEALPLGAREELPRAERGADALCALVEHPAGAERVVADLAVAHVVVGRQADGGPVGTQRADEVARGEAVEVGLAREPDRVAVVVPAAADAVHHDDEHGAGDPFEARVRAELPGGHGETGLSSPAREVRRRRRDHPAAPPSWAGRSARLRRDAYEPGRLGTRRAPGTLSAKRASRGSPAPCTSHGRTTRRSCPRPRRCSTAG